MTSLPLHGIPVLEDLPTLATKRVLVRTDFNVPLSFDASLGRQVVADDFRIRAALPTLEWLRERGAKITTCCHLGRPEGSFCQEFIMTPVRERLEELCPGVELLENLRFSEGEKNADPTFISALVEGYDAYVNEAFGVAHRGHASVIGPPRYLPSAAGRLLAHEVDVLDTLLHHPMRPFVAIVGGAKIKDKLGVLEALAPKVDSLLVGGAMAFTFLAALGHHTGDSLVDAEHIESCKRLLDGTTPIHLPLDIVALTPKGALSRGDDANFSGETQVFENDLLDGWIGYDIGPETVKAFRNAIQDAGTVLWNGPLGVVEDSRFAAGTLAVAEAVADCSGFTVVGGGDSVHALELAGVVDRVKYVSTGGGASLSFLEHGDLPALAALRSASNAPKN